MIRDWPCASYVSKGKTSNLRFQPELAKYLEQGCVVLNA